MHQSGFKRAKRLGLKKIQIIKIAMLTLSDEKILFSAFKVWILKFICLYVYTNIFYFNILARECSELDNGLFGAEKNCISKLNS